MPILSDTTKERSVKNPEDAIVLEAFKRENDQVTVYCDHCNRTEAYVYVDGPVDMVVVTVELKRATMIRGISCIDEYDDVPTGRKMHSHGSMGIYPTESTSHETERKVVSQRVTNELTYWYKGACDRCDREVKIQVPIVRTIVHRDYDV